MKTKHHEIDIEGFTNWMNVNETTYASSSIERKKLTVTPSGKIFVRVNDAVIYEGNDPSEAVEKYNDIFEKY